jgi:hypothetical protein
MTTVRCRMKCIKLEVTEYATAVSLEPFHSTDPNDPNKSWSAATPAGRINLTITNKDAAVAFEIGKFYFIDFNVAG